MNSRNIEFWVIPPESDAEFVASMEDFIQYSAWMSNQRALVKRIKWCYTPKHGSWLNIAENELSSITRQCVSGHRIGSIEELQNEISAWSNDVNAKQRGVDWQMKIDDARCKLKSVYPKIRV